MKPETSALLGQQVGHIRVVDLLGEGGMGAVYVGFDDKLQRKVALKAIRSEYRLHEEAKARFLREARILSQLDHPHICTVHDFIEGEDCDFLVLELVKGKSLREVMKDDPDYSAKMSIARQLLEVLVAVHGQGVIHRDLKPENVMISPDAGIKVLDFGLSRSAEEESSTSSVAETLGLDEVPAEADPDMIVAASKESQSTYDKTELGTVLGTIGYMSPEQARAEPATAASDMYALGLILQELFTGSRLFEEGLEAQELLRRAASGETGPVSGLAPDLTALIERMKALATGTRPSSVDALAELDRIIDRPRRKRRRALVAAIWTALLLFAGGMAVQSIRAAREAERAEHEAGAARQVSEFLVSMFEGFNPEAVGRNTVSVQDVLEMGMSRVDAELVDQPLLQATLMQTIAQIHAILGNVEQATPLLERAVALREASLGPDSPEVAETLRMLGWHQVNRRQLSQAEASIARALSIQESILGPDHPAVAETLRTFAYLYGHLGETAKEVDVQERALAIQETALGPDHPEVADSLDDLATLKSELGRIDEAESLFQRSLRIREMAPHQDQERLANTLWLYGMFNRGSGRLDRARALLERALTIREERLGPGHPAVAFALDGCAFVHRDQGLFAEAEALHRRALGIRVEVFGLDHPMVCGSHKLLAELFAAQARDAEAEASFHRAIDCLGRETPAAVRYTYSLAAFLAERGRLAEAETVYRHAVDSLQKGLGPDHPDAARAVDALEGFLNRRAGYKGDTSSHPP